MQHSSTTVPFNNIFRRVATRVAAACIALVGVGVGCSAGEELDYETASESITATELVGRITTAPGTFVNRCVDNVQTAFSALPEAPSGRMRYRSQGGKRLPPNNAVLEPFGSFTHHVQGVTRFAHGFDNDRRWLAVSRAHQLHRGGFFLVHLADANGADGGRLFNRGATFPSDPVAGRETKFFYPIRDTEHPGGMQAFGKYLAIASEAPVGLSSFVDIYDFTGGPGAGRRLQRVTLPTTGAFPVARVIGGVGMSMLRDGRFLMFVLGQDKNPQGWFFVSNTANNLTATTQWLPLTRVPGNPTWGEYQNVSLITECNTGTIFVLATGNASYASDQLPGTNQADLFRTGVSETGAVTMTRVARRNFDDGDDGFCTFRAAATGHADKDGKLILYCHAHHANTDIIDGPDSKLKMAEYATNGCLATQTTCGNTCCSQGSACVNGSCCPVGNSCGSACCGNNTVCANASRSLCCDRLSTACGNSCCGLGQQCVNNACVTPPPPPPPQPTTCGLFQPCGPGGTCPGNQLCFGTTGCCGILR